MREALKRLRRYFGFSFVLQRRFYAMEGWGLSLRTPLFALQLSKHSYEFDRHDLFSGIKLWLLPLHGNLEVEEGVTMYRHYFERVTRYQIENLLVLK